MQKLSWYDVPNLCSFDARFNVFFCSCSKSAFFIESFNFAGFFLFLRNLFSFELFVS